jgi:RNA polymerase sigma factor FliA
MSTHGPIQEEWLPLVEKHLGLAHSIALKVYRSASHALELDELRSIAYMGLVDACARWPDYCAKKGYDPNATEFFTTYSGHRIRGSIFDHLRQADWATRSLRDKSKKLRVAGSDEGVSRQELAERSGLTEKEVHDTIAGMSRAPVSLDQMFNNASSDNDQRGYTDIPSAEDVESHAESNYLINAFANAVQDLPGDERLILVLHYYGNMELKKISSMLDIVESRTSQLHTKSVLSVLDKLKEVATNS